MLKKYTPDPVKYGFKPTNYVNGMPWPRLPEVMDDKVPLKEEYRMYSMDYLDTLEARPIFEKQADIIMKHGYKGIVDVGCRHGPVLDILHERGYEIHYFGFDTSSEPIKYANETWKDFPNINFIVGSFNEVTRKFKTNFTVECILWSGVLLYEPKDHMKIFEGLHKFYDCDNAIIQEPMKDQRTDCWREGLELNTIADIVSTKYKDKYDRYEQQETDCNIFSGRRLIADITLSGLIYPKSKVLKCGFKVIPYIWKGDFNFELSSDEAALCRAAIAQMDNERKGQRLEDNYSYKELKLDKMFMYNFVFDGTEPVFCSGAQTDGDAVRVFSRYFGFNKYRTDGTDLLAKSDNFDELEYTLGHINNSLIYWSRDKSPNFFHKLKEGRPDIFNEWEVYPEKIEIIYPNNRQHIFYNGDIDEILR